MQEIIISKAIHFNDDHYQIDLQINNLDKYGRKFRNLDEDSNANFGFTVHSYKMLGTFSIKIKLKEFI